MPQAVFAWLLSSALPAAVAFYWAIRHGRAELGRRTVLGMVLGVLFALFGVWLRGVVSRRMGAVPPLALALSFDGPLEAGSILAAAWPTRERRRDAPAIPAAARVVLVASAFVLAKNAEAARHLPWSSIAVAGLLVRSLSSILLAGLWGYTLSRPDREGRAGRWFFPIWVVCSLVGGLFHHLVAQRTSLGVIGATPGLLLLLGLAWSIRGGLRSDERATEVERRVRSAIYEARDALADRRRARPSIFRMVGFAVACQGTILLFLAVALFFGHRAGVDFAAIEDAGGEAALPLVVLGMATLAAFPVTGFVVAKASRAPTLADPAFGATLAIVVVLAVLGATSASAITFAVFAAPVALVLACAGGWLGAR